MKRTIEHCFENKKIASIFCDTQNTEAHYTGYINAYNEKEIVISHITPTGLYDGYILRRVEDIYRIDYDSSYEKKIEILYKLRNQVHDTIPSSKELFYSIVKYAKNNKAIITFHFADNCLTGIICDFNDNNLIMNCIDDNGRCNGLSSILVDNVLYVDLDTENEQSLSLLYFNK